MVGCLLLLPMVFVSMAANLLMAMLMAAMSVMILAMGVFMGALIAYSTAFISFIVIMFS